MSVVIDDRRMFVYLVMQSVLPIASQSVSVMLLRQVLSLMTCRLQMSFLHTKIHFSSTYVQLFSNSKQHGQNTAANNQ